ncbi:MAG: hypothetical protein CUN56_02860 [Phototrophicales bacterium]|nr:MAG: hypothetical protein CUN56_02860 [Phototrophicales bacterium]
MRIIRATLINHRVIKWGNYMSKVYTVLTLVVCLGVFGLSVVLAVPVPNLTLNVPSAPSIGEAFTFTAVFQNTGTTPGYGPFVDMVLPATGADGNDGVTFISAQYLSIPLQADVQTFPAGGCVSHPFARDTSNQRLDVCGTPGDQLVTIRLPFGSFVPSQPPVEIEVTAQMSNLADVGTALAIQARAGFEFGADPLRNPCCDPVVVFPIEADTSLWGSTSFTPALIGASKTSTAEERGTETAVGANFVYQYTINMNIPDGVTVNNFQVIDDLANMLVFVSLDDVLVNGVSTGAYTATLPPTGAPQNPPNNHLSITLTNPITGTLADDDVQVVFSYYVAEVDADGNPTIDVSGERLIQNTVSAAGDWIPADARDDAFSGSLPCPVCGAAPLHALWARAMALQKDSAVFIDNGVPGVNPGDIVQNTIVFQLADNFTAASLIIEDIFTDGLAFHDSSPGCTPSYNITDSNGTSTGAFTIGSDLTITSPFDAQGRTQLLFDVSAALGGGSMVGGNGADGTITYCTVILDDFLAPVPGNTPGVDLGDTLSNEANVQGQLTGTNPGDPIIPNFREETGADLEIENGVPSKVIYAVNGVPCGVPCELDPGDLVTYRITYDLPTSDFDELTLTDFLPLPVFAISSMTFNDIISGTAPGENNAQFGPGDSFRALSGIVPSVLIDSVNNTVTFDYGSYDHPTTVSSTIDILFTVRTTNEPFAHDLTLVNQLMANEQNSFNVTAQGVAATAFGIRQPFLRVRKGVVGTDNPSSQITPSLPLPFAPPGDPGAPWSGTINSQLLDGTDINADVFNADNGDLIRFAIIIENVGDSPEGAFDIIVRDILEPGFAIPPGGINLTVRRGDGTVLSFNGNELDLFSTGIELVDPNATEGVCQTYDLTSGGNIVVLTYDLLVQTDTDAFGRLTNTAGVTQYTYADGLGATANFVSDGQVYADGADVNGDAPAVNIFDPAISKIGFLLPGQLGIEGEQVEWIITITNPSNVTGYDVTISDTLRPELRLDRVEISSGTATINGQTISVYLPSLAPGEVVTMSVFTTVLVNSDRIGEIENTVCALARDMIGEECYIGRVVSTLPATGEGFRRVP